MVEIAACLDHLGMHVGSTGVDGRAEAETRGETKHGPPLRRCCEGCEGLTRPAGLVVKMSFWASQRTASWSALGVLRLCMHNICRERRPDWEVGDPENWF